jgi:hypothetical protein
MPRGDAVFVDAAHASDPWLAVGDVILDPQETAAIDAAARARSLLSGTGGLLVAVNLGRSRWLVCDRDGQCLTVAGVDDGRRWPLGWLVRCYRAVLVGRPLTSVSVCPGSLDVTG